MSPERVTVRIAKLQLSRLIKEACEGHEIVIVRRNVPVVRLVPIQAQPTRRKFGAMTARAMTTAAFFEPMSEHELVGSS